MGNKDEKNDTGSEAVKQLALFGSPAISKPKPQELKLKSKEAISSPLDQIRMSEGIPQLVLPTRW